MTDLSQEITSLLNQNIGNTENTEMDLFLFALDHMTLTKGWSMMQYLNKLPQLAQLLAANIHALKEIYEGFKAYRELLIEEEVLLDGEHPYRAFNAYRAKQKEKALAQLAPTTSRQSPAIDKAPLTKDSHPLSRL